MLGRGWRRWEGGGRGRLETGENEDELHFHGVSLFFSLHSSSFVMARGSCACITIHIGRFERERERERRKERRPLYITLLTSLSIPKHQSNMNPKPFASPQQNNIHPFKNKTTSPLENSKSFLLFLLPLLLVITYINAYIPNTHTHAHTQFHSSASQPSRSRLALEPYECMPHFPGKDCDL